MLITGSQLAVAFGAGLVLQFTALAQAVPSPETATLAQERFDEMAALYPALNATVMIEGEIVWEAEGGNHRDDADGVDRDYNVYSVAKLMVALAYLRLEQESGLDLDMSVREVDASLPESYENVTLRALLDHQAGVRHYTSEADWIAFSERRCRLPADALGHFINDPLVPSPEGEMTYTTFGYVLLSHLLVRLTGADDFDTAMQSVLGEAYRARLDQEGADKAANWIDLGEGLERVDGLSAECKFGGGGLLASSRDLATLLSAVASDSLVQTTALAQETGPWAGYSETLRSHYIAHSGGSPGGRAFMFALIEPHVSVALTANSDGPNFYALSLDLVTLFAGLDDAPAED